MAGLIGIRTAGLSLVFWLGFVMLAWSTAAQAQTLVEVYELALRLDRESVQLESRKEALDARHAQSLASYYPQLSGKADIGRYSRVALPGGEVPAANARVYSVEATQPLYKPGRKQAAAQSRLAQAGFRYEAESLQQGLMLKYADSYLACVAARYVVQAAAAQMRSLGAQFETVQRAYETGSATLIDKHEAQTRYQSAIAQHEAASSDLAVRLEALKNPLRLAEVRLPILAMEKFDPSRVQDWLMTVNVASVEASPGLVAARMNVDIAKLDISKERAAHLPQVEFGVSYTHTHDGRYTASGQTPSRQKAGHLLISVPLFSGFATNARTSEAIARHRIAEEEFEDTRMRQYDSFAQARTKLASAAAQLKAYMEAERSAVAYVQANKYGYESGVRLSSDVFNAESYLFQVRRDVSRVQYELLVAYLTMKRAAGVLSRDDLDVIDKSLLTRG